MRPAWWWIELRGKSVGRQQRRVKLKQSMAEMSRRGMDLTANGAEQTWAVIAATRVALDVLRGHGPSRASNAAKRAHDFFEISLKHNPSKHAIACTKGCTFCCHVSVTATAPEIFLVASTIREQHKQDFEAVLNRVRASDQRTHGLSSMERARQKIPCAMLSEGACSVYGARPGACRGFTSTSAQDCESGFNGQPVQIKTPSVWTALMNAHKQALWAALAAAELPVERYEFHHALRIVLETPDAENRWLSGEDIFAGVAREIVSNDTAKANNKRIIDTLVAGALGKEMPG
jgi:Fe-S-cluster containining protein